MFQTFKKFTRICTLLFDIFHKFIYIEFFTRDKVKTYLKCKLRKHHFHPFYIHDIQKEEMKKKFTLHVVSNVYFPLKVFYSFMICNCLVKNTTKKDEKKCDATMRCAYIWIL